MGDLWQSVGVVVGVLVLGGMAIWTGRDATKAWDARRASNREHIERVQQIERELNWMRECQRTAGYLVRDMAREYHFDITDELPQLVLQLLGHRETSPNDTTRPHAAKPWSGSHRAGLERRAD